MNNLRQFLPRRELGRTGFEATVLGIGDLADRSLPLETCVATVRRALEAGLNLIDTAPGYEDGYSEQIVGEAVEGFRDRLFVIDKIDELEAPVAPQIDASLRRLQLDHADAFVFHGLSSLESFKDSPSRAVASTNWLPASKRARPASAASLPTTPTCCTRRSRPAFAISRCSRWGRLSTCAT